MQEGTSHDDNEWEVVGQRQISPLFEIVARKKSTILEMKAPTQAPVQIKRVTETNEKASPIDEILNTHNDK